MAGTMAHKGSGRMDRPSMRTATMSGTLAREAQRNGDTIEMENCYQHAEHYFRVMNDRG
jgi:hypothetical protein